MIFGRQIVSNWLKNTRAVSKRYQDPGLSALLVAQLILIFVAEPLAFEGLEPPLIATGIIVAGLILLLVLGSHQHGALIIVVVAGGVRLLTAGAGWLSDRRRRRSGAASAVSGDGLAG